MKKNVNIAVVGLGQIGNYLLNEINTKKRDIELKTGKKINVVAISAKSRNKKRKFKINKKLWLKNYIDAADKKDVDIELCDGVLTIKHDGPKEDNSAEEALHKGIAKRAFKLKFTLAEDLEVLGAAIKNGLLTVNLERVVPDHKKPRVIEVK